MYSSMAEEASISALFLQAFTGHRICFVAGHLKYKKYVCVPGALHLRHPVNAYGSAVYNALVVSNPVNGYPTVV